jgi:hypothetical protein
VAPNKAGTGLWLTAAIDVAPIGDREDEHDKATVLQIADDAVVADPLAKLDPATYSLSLAR